MTYNYIDPIGNPDHFVSAYVRWAADQCDAALEYHEALAFALLATATRGVKARLIVAPQGVRSNMYYLLYGPSTSSRKSTAMRIARNFATARLPGPLDGFFAPPDFTPGGLEAELQDRDGEEIACTVFVDEFTKLFGKMQTQRYMDGLRHTMMTLYNQPDTSYRRANKGASNNKEDKVEIHNAHLTIVGNVTPAITKRVKATDIDDGFLARFSVVYPTEFPQQRSMFAGHCDEKEGDRLAFQLDGLKKWSYWATGRKTQAQNGGYSVEYDPVSLQVLDDYQRQYNALAAGDDVDSIMAQRAVDMLLKISMLVRLGYGVPPKNVPVLVTAADMEIAGSVVDRYIKGGIRMANHIDPSAHEEQVQKYLRKYGARREMPRRHIARGMHLSKREMDELQFTLIDRGLIALEERGERFVLHWVNQTDEAKKPAFVVKEDSDE